MKLMIPILPFLEATVIAQDGFSCTDGSEFAFIEDIIGLNHCLDSDAVPSSIFEPSETNFLLNSGNPDAAINGVYFLDVGGGHIIFGNGAYMNSLYIYERGCKGEKMGKNNNENYDSQEGSGGGGGARQQGGTMDDNHVRRNRMLQNNKRANKGRRISSSLGQQKKKSRRDLKGKKGDKKMCDVATYGAIILGAPTNYGPTFGETIANYLAEKDAVLTTMIVSHTHYDHIGGWSNLFSANPYLESYIASEEIAEALEVLQHTEYGNSVFNEIFNSNPAGPNFDIDIVVEGWEELDIGNQTLEFRPVGGHQAGNLLVYHEASETLTLIDSVVFPKWSPFYGLVLAVDGPASFQQYDIFRQYEYKYFLAGHFTHLGTPEDVEISEKYIADIVDAAYNALLTVNSPAAFGATGAFTPGDPDFGNLLLGFGNYVTAVNHACAATVLNPSENNSGYEWISVLAGVRVTIYSHCNAVVNFLRLDNPGI